MSQCRLIFWYLPLMVQQSGQTPVEKLVIHMSRCLKNQGLHQMGVSSCIFKGVSSWKLTYTILQGTFEDEFPIPQVGYVNSLVGIFQGVSMGCGCGAASRQHSSFHLVAMADPSLIKFHFQKAPAHCYSETQIMDRLLEMSECLDRTLRNATGRLLGEPSADTFASVVLQLPWSSSPSTQVSPLRPWSLGGVVLLENFQVESGIHGIHHTSPYTKKNRDHLRGSNSHMLEPPVIWPSPPFLGTWLGVSPGSL